MNRLRKIGSVAAGVTVGVFWLFLLILAISVYLGFWFEEYDKEEI